MNDTIIKYGYPQTLIKDFKYWVVLLRSKQVTLGSFILACKEDVDSLSKVTPQAYQELAIITQELEQTLKCLFKMERINYLALMMVDNHVHFHVIPRYSSFREFGNKIYFDENWPKPPDILSVHNLSESEFDNLKNHLLNYWK